MIILGAESTATSSALPGFTAKMVLNRNGAILFPVSRQHREMKAEGISYEDDYKGDAMAAMLMPGLIEIRYHKAFTDAEVSRIVGRLLQQPKLAFMSGWRVTYQGRPVVPVF